MIKQLPLSLQKSLIRSLTFDEKKRLLDVLAGKSVFYDDDPGNEFCIVPQEYIDRALKIATEEGVQNQPTSSVISIVAAAAKAANHVESESSSPVSSLDPIGVASSSYQTVAPSTRLNVSGSRRPEVAILDVIQNMMFSHGDIHYIDTDTHHTLAWPSLYTAMRIADDLVVFIGEIMNKLPTKQPLHMAVRLFPKQARVYFKWKHMSSISKQEQNASSVRPLSNRLDDGEEVDDAKDSFQFHQRSRSTDTPSTTPNPSTARKRKPSTKSTMRRSAKKRQKMNDSDGDGDGSGVDESESESTAKRKSTRRKKKEAAHESGGSGSEIESSSGDDSEDEDYTPYPSHATQVSGDDRSDGEEEEEIESDHEVELAQSAAGEEDVELHEVEEIIETTSKLERIGATKPNSSAAASTVQSSESTAATSGSSSSSSSKVAYDIYLSDLDLHLGPLFRLHHQDLLSSPMSLDHYKVFVRARESSFVTPPRRCRHFMSWLRLPSWLGRNVLHFLGYLTWDRIGMIIQVCQRWRQRSRHARSNLPFTVYEVNQAIQYLEKEPQTSTMFLTDSNYVRSIKSEMDAFIENRNKIQQQLQQHEHQFHNTDITSNNASASHSTDDLMDSDVPAPGDTNVSSLQMLIRDREQANQVALANLGDSVLTNDVEAIARLAKLSASDSTPTSAQPSSFASVLPSSVTALPPPNLASSPSISLSTYPISSSRPASSPCVSNTCPKSRFSESARIRLHQMAEACGWKYRRANPAVQAIHQEEGLELDQIRCWMANNKPTELKKKIQQPGAKKKAAQ